MFQFKQNEATIDRRRIFFYAVSSTDGFTPITASITSGVVQIIKNGNTPGTTPVSPTFTHIGSGLWYYEMTAAHLDTQGVLAVTITGTNIRTAQLIGYIYAGDPMAAIPTFPTNFSSLAITVGGSVTANTTQWGGTAVTGMPMPTYTQPSGFLSAAFPAGTIANTTNITGGTITTVSGNVNGSVNSVTTGVTLASGAISTGTFAAGAINAAAIATDALTSAKFQDGALIIGATTGTGVKISHGVNSITAGVIANGAIDAATFAAGAIDSAAIATDAIDADAIANSAITIRMSGDAIPSEGRIVAGTVASDVWNALLTSHTTANTFGARSVRTRSTSPSNEVVITGSFHIACDVHELQPDVIDNTHFTDSTLVIGSAAGTGVKIYLDANSITAGVIANNAIDAAAIAADADEAIADAILNRNLAGGGNGTGATTDRTVRSALRALRNKSAIVGSTLTVYDENDSGTAWTAAVSTTAGANPVTGIDPAGP